MQATLEQSPRIQQLPDRLPVAWVRVLLVALPTFYFFAIFWPALIGGKTYGNRLNQEKLAAGLDDYFRTAPLKSPLAVRAPELIHPDYELLYQPLNREIQTAFRNGRLPLYDPHRILGTLIWGSPVSDAANPLNSLLLIFSPEHVHLIKIYLYTVLAFVGVYFCATVVFSAEPIASLIGASLYVLTPFMYYMYHWAGLYGVVSLAPLLFCLIHVSLTQPSFPFLALLETVFAWILLINQLQALLYFCLFLALWIFVALSLGIYSLGKILRPALLVGLSLLGGIAFSLGYTRYILEAGTSLARSPHTDQVFSRSWSSLLNSKLLLQMWTNGLPLSFHHYDANLVFFPVTVLAAILAVILGARRRLTRYHAALGVVLAILAVHCLIWPLHYPLYLLHLPLYHLNWEHWRVVYLLYFAMSLAASCAITLLRRGFETNRRRPLAICFFGLTVFYGFWSATALTHLDLIPVPLTAMFGFGVLALRSRRQYSRGYVIALGACMIAGSLYLPVTRVPFYNRSDAPQAAAPQTTDRTMRLIPFEQISQARGELLWYNDSVMAMFGKNGLTGYDTALQQKEARLFSRFYSRGLQRFRQNNVLLRYGVQSSIVWPDADQVLAGGNTLGILNEARLKLLGAGSLMWNKRITNLPAPIWDNALRSWNHPLPTASTVSLLETAQPPDVARLFSEGADNALADRILSHRQAAQVRFDETSGKYTAELPAGTGLVMIAYNVGRFYQPFVDGVAANLETTDLPFLFVRKANLQPAILELRPQTSGIWFTTWIGITLGLLILGALKWAAAYTANSVG